MTAFFILHFTVAGVFLGLALGIMGGAGMLSVDRTWGHKPDWAEAGRMLLFATLLTTLVSAVVGTGIYVLYLLTT